MVEQEFSHLDGDGRIKMVDISAKESTHRIALASCVVTNMSSSAKTLEADLSPGVILSARLTGIQAAKRTAHLIPLCHPLVLSSVHLDIETHGGAFVVSAQVTTNAGTGVEMEALTACAFAALALVASLVVNHPDVCVSDLALLRKSGGKSGDWGRDIRATS